MKRDKETVYLVSHTHWDREWYLPFQTYRLKLLDVIDRIIKRLTSDSAFRHFLMDGQAVILEDFLEIHPQQEKNITALVARDKLAIGPWYVLPDEFLVSAEAMVRNLILGHQVCEKFGGAQKVGYMPDSFGHFAQMPQILKKAGIGSFVYTRGNGEEIDDLGAEFHWQAPDGSEVLAIQQLDGYCNAGGLGYADILDVYADKPVDPDLAVQQFGKLLTKMRNHANGKVYLFNNGCDHFPPQKDLGLILEHLEQAFPGVEIIHASLSAFLEKIRSGSLQPKRFRGELLSGKYHHILSGVWSARMHLKQLNHRCQTLLAGYSEPVMSYLHFVHGMGYPDELFTYCWKSLLKNHPHDSICGCSVDEVHREMIPRFEGVLQAGTAVMARAIQTLFKSGEDVVITLINPHPRKRTAFVDRYFVLPKGKQVRDLRITDDRGKPIGVEIIDLIYSEDFWLVEFDEIDSIDDQFELLNTYRKKYPHRFHTRQDSKGTRIPLARLQFIAEDLPGCGLIHYRVDLASGSSFQSGSDEKVRLSGNVLENRYYKLTVKENGMFDLLDKLQHKKYSNLNMFEDTEDAGDEYDYAPAAVSQTLTSQHRHGRLETVIDTLLCGALRATFDLQLPQSVRNDRRGRTVRKINCRVETTLMLEADSRIIRITTRFNNRAKDHRLRVWFPAGVKSEELVSDGHYYVNRRRIKQPAGTAWVQAPTGTFPQQGFSLIEDDENGFVLFNKGLPEIAPLAGKTGKITLALTLLRSVEWLSRDDLKTRKGNAGPMKYTPEAQCPGMHVFEYALATYGGSFLKQPVVQLADEYQVPVYVRQQQGQLPVEPSRAGLLEIQSDLLRISAIKKHCQRDTLICRVYNLSGRKTNGQVICGLDIRQVWQTDLLENRMHPVTISENDRFTINLGPFEIMTFEIKFAGRQHATAG